MYTDLALHIGGGWRNGDGRQGEDVVNPATEKALGRLPHASASDLDEALAAGKKGFEVWRGAPAYEPAQGLRQAATPAPVRGAPVAPTVTPAPGTGGGGARPEARS